MLARGRRLLAGWLLPAIAGACSPDEYAILLAVRSQGDVQTLRVTVVPTDGRGRALRSGERPVYRSREDIDEREPLRVAIALDGPRRVLVHLLARDREERAFVATRCYAVGGVVRDRAMLVGPIGPETDVDGDGWPGDASSTCFDPGGPGEPPRPCPDARRCALPAPDCMDCEGCEDIHPGADELCADDVDQDCDGQDAPCTDEDGDGWRRCSATDLPGTCDCDDAVAGIHPDADDPCGDFVDQDCSGADNACDRDGDGFAADVDRGGSPDCDDTDPLIHPDAAEVCTPEGSPTRVDENCNGLVDELLECAPDDLDRDGSPDCSVVEPGVPCDCNDCDPGVRPGTTDRCGDDVDGDCSGADEACPAGDTDRDGHGARASGGPDCDDSNPAIHPGAPEVCGDGTSQSCTADVDCTGDTDGDGYVAPDDCAENDPSRAPRRPDVCNGGDDDCDGVTDEVLHRPTHSASGAPLPHGPTGCVFRNATVPDCASESCPVDLTTNVFHCGRCRYACNPPDRVVANACVDGVCDCTSQPGISACAAGETCCLPAAGCRQLATDFFHCGRCNVPCQATANRCVGGTCRCGARPSCDTGQLCCPPLGAPADAGSCVDPRTDPNHCGTCGNVCGPRMSCIDRRCQCNAPYADCDGNQATGCEIDPTVDLDHCGGCGRRCRRTNATARCTGGVCSIDTCNVGWDDCNRRDDDGCETSLRTLTDCGACGIRCARANATATCATGACRIERCNPGWDDCNRRDDDGCETPLNTLTDCGACGRTCSLPNATATCASGSCRIERCNPGWDNCNGRHDDGCETPLNTTSNCGACGVACSRPNATATCATGSCRIERCHANWGDCNGVDADGCETNLLSSASHCGACGNGCGTNGICVGGGCACMSPWLDCDGARGCETRGDTVGNCRMCGRNCDDGNVCTTDSCGPTDCVRTNNNNPCNDGDACTVSDVCSGGMCRGTPMSCDRGMSCFAGMCRCGSASGPMCSAPNWCCAGSCVDRSIDVNHCGACGRTCSSGQTCCGGNCVDTNTDENHCGGCGRVCSGGQTCCGGSCVDTTADENHCGTCGNACGAGRSCCASACVDTESSTTNCGRCGARCAIGETCSGGRCCCGSDCGAPGSGRHCPGGPMPQVCCMGMCASPPCP